MCELFGISSSVPVQPKELLKTFFSHSVNNPNGWGLAIFYGEAVSLEKEPRSAKDSNYLRERLRHRIEVINMMAHIRKATRGSIDYENCHPFVMRDFHNRAWTLMHNGTIFNHPIIDEYVHSQEGNTDSERILCYIVDEVNKRQEELGRPMDISERFELIDRLVCSMAPHNKINLLIYDGELYYVHTNYKNSLYLKHEKETTFFSTTQLEPHGWTPVPFTTLQAYKDGQLLYSGTNHGFEYIDDPEDMKYMYLDYLEC